MKELLTINELSEKLKVTRQFVYKLMNEGMPYLMVGKTRRFDPDEVMNYLKNKGR